jgi:hypothetical protein
MQKLTNDQLEVLVLKRNELGLTHTVEVMNNEELAAYKINCIEAIERLTNQIKKAKTGGVMQSSLIETKEMLEGFITYIDSKLNEQRDQTVSKANNTLPTLTHKQENKLTANQLYIYNGITKRGMTIEDIIQDENRLYKRKDSTKIVMKNISSIEKKLGIKIII